MSSVQLSRFIKDFRIIVVGLPFVVLSIAPNPGEALTSKIKGWSFSLFFAGRKSTPINCPFTNSEALIESIFSNSVSSIDGEIVSPYIVSIYNDKFKSFSFFKLL